MTLEDYIFTSIWAYPGLYHKNSFQNSRISVLEHMFLTIGTGVKYRKDYKGFSDCDEYKLIVDKEVQQRIKNGEFIVNVGKPDKTDKWFLLFPDRSQKKSESIFLSDFLKSNENYYEFGQERPDEVKDWPIIEKFPDRKEDRDFEPYPFSIEYCPFWDREKNDFIPKNEIASDWLAGIIEIFEIAKEWFSNDEKWNASDYYNWAGNWKKTNNIFLQNWNKSTDKLKLCDDYAIERKEYSSAQEMAIDICKKNRNNYIQKCDKVLNFYK